MRIEWIVSAFAAAVIAVSCAAKLEPTPEQEDRQKPEQDQNALSTDENDQVITIEASIEGIETKTEFSEANGAVLWSPGDAISLFYGSGTAGGSQFTSTATEPAAVTNFTGTIGVITGGADIAVEDTYFWGVYPYSPTTSCDGSSVTMSLPSEQVAKAGSFAPGMSPSIGRSQGLSMGFFNICGGVKFSVTQPGLKRVTLTSNSGEEIAGTARIAIGESGLPVVQEIISGTDTIVLEAPEGQYLEVGQFYYMMMFPTTFSTGFTLTLETFTETTTVEKNKTINIGRSYFGRMSNVDSGATYTQKTGNIPIPDANFKAYMVENFDTDDDGEISYEEALAVEEIRVCTDNIASLKGIEYMLNLNQLRFFGGEPLAMSGQVETIDISNNTALTSLRISDNPIRTLNITNNTSLTTLSLSITRLNTLDVSNNMALEQLTCELSDLNELNVSNNTALIYLNCGDNQLTSLDVSNNTALEQLVCCSNGIASLDVSNNTALIYLQCDYNQLTGLDLSDNEALTDIRCNNNQLVSLDVTNNTALTYMDCYHNCLSSLDVSNNLLLDELHCSSNQLTSLDVSNNTALTYLNCSDNQLTCLDISNNTALTLLSCSNNQLTTVDVSHNTVLEYLYCYNDQFTSLDVSNNTDLVFLDCSPNYLLGALYIATGQSIPNVTENRSSEYIPDGTQIVVKPVGGGNEGFGEGDI